MVTDFKYKITGFTSIYWYRSIDVLPQYFTSENDSVERPSRNRFSCSLLTCTLYYLSETSVEQRDRRFIGKDGK